jgi:hypothetical protein
LPANNTKASSTRNQKQCSKQQDEFAFVPPAVRFLPVPRLEKYPVYVEFVLPSTHQVVSTTSHKTDTTSFFHKKARRGSHRVTYYCTFKPRTAHPDPLRMIAAPSLSLLIIAVATMLSRTAVTAFLSRARSPLAASRTISGSSLCFAKEGQAEVVLVGCGAPNRGTTKRPILQVEDDDNGKIVTHFRGSIVLSSSSWQEWGGTTPFKCSKTSEFQSNVFFVDTVCQVVQAVVAEDTSIDDSHLILSRGWISNAK